MSCCYFADMRLKFRNGGDAATKEAAREELAEFLRKGIDDDGREFDAGVDHFAEQGVTTDTIEGCIDIILAGWEGQRVQHGIYQKDEDGECCGELVPTDENGFLVFSNGFDARYCWLTVMVHFFNRLAKYLEDGSYFHIEYENEWSRFMVRKGEAFGEESGTIDDLESPGDSEGVEVEDVEEGD